MCSTAVTVNQDCFVGPVELLVLAGIEYRQQEHPPVPQDFRRKGLEERDSRLVLYFVLHL